ncbi:MAG: peptidoglycan-binding protein [candidate division Zixibacteria bacterium]|nr:peptidoglycan-binding protein [candidate division Zixibacteria bacterium]
MADFIAALKKLAEAEGGYANNPNDKGGETFKGISRKYHSDWPGWKRVDLLKTSPDFPRIAEADPDLTGAVGVFYRVEYWNRIKGDDIPQQEIAEYLFDTAVNFGTGPTDPDGASIYLQSALNEMGATLTVDGVIGPATLSALRTLGSAASSRELLMWKLTRRRLVYRVKACLADRSQTANLLGWLRRDLRLGC